jgi:pyruvate formate lyase activating enzyme
MVRRRKEVGKAKIEVNGREVEVPKPATLKKALQIAGIEFVKFPQEGRIFAPCEVGGCWSCIVKVDDKLERSCVTPVREGMRISTELPEHIPLRIVHGPQGHTVGGVGTPYKLKGYRYIEVVNFTAGCNLRCPQCQNWSTTYCGKEAPLTPREAAERITRLGRLYGVERFAVSGGEPTLNRKWLVEYFKELRRLNPHARIHLDTNATLLIPDYIDELVQAGMTDCGIDLKGCELKTFQKITGIADKKLARKYLEVEWKAVRYILDNHPEVFVGLGIPYNKDLISMDEIARIGELIFKLNPDIQVCALDYRPEFRAVRLSRPSLEEMMEVHQTLRGTGLKTVIAQTWRGYIDPSGKLM